MDVIVFGGCGLIGSYVCADLCEQGMTVTAFDLGRPKGILRAFEDRVRWLQGDIGDAEQVGRAIKESGARRIVLLAAALQFDCDRAPEKAMRTNVGGTVNVLDAAHAGLAERVVFASSGAAYGIRADRMREEMPVGPELSIYGASKVLGERLGNQYAERHGFDFIALRYNMTYGPGEVTSPGMAKVVQDITEAMGGAPVTMSEVGGDIHRQLTYVRDSAAATVLALTHPRPSHRLYNVAGPEENYVSLREFCAIMRQVVPESGSVTFTGQGREAGPVDTTRIRQDLGFTPRYDIADGLRAKRQEHREWW